MVNLQPIDVSILKALLKDGRQSFTSIAELNNVSLDVISNHFSEMQKTGVIVGATIQFNYVRFGYQAVTSILIKSETKYHKKIIDDLKKVPNIFASGIYCSAYNIAVTTTIRSLNELDHVKQLIKNRYPIDDIRTYIWTDVRNIPENLSFGLSENCELNNIQDFDKSKTDFKTESLIDDLDWKIVDELTINGRESFEQIAKKIGTSTITVNRRYKKLVKNNYFKVCLQVNPQLLGYKAFVMSWISTYDRFENKIVALANLLSEIKDVSYIVKISGGDHDLMVCTLVREFEDLYKVTDQIRQLPNVEKLDAYVRKIPPVWPTKGQFISTF